MGYEGMGRPLWSPVLTLAKCKLSVVYQFYNLLLKYEYE